MSYSFSGPLPIPYEQLEVAKKQARLVGCPDDNSENIVKCLRTVPADKFNDALFQFKVSRCSQHFIKSFSLLRTIFECK